MPYIRNQNSSPYISNGAKTLLQTTKNIKQQNLSPISHPGSQKFPPTNYHTLFISSHHKPHQNNSENSLMALKNQFHKQILMESHNRCHNPYVIHQVLSIQFLIHLSTRLIHLDPTIHGSAVIRRPQKPLFYLQTLCWIKKSGCNNKHFWIQFSINKNALIYFK